VPDLRILQSEQLAQLNGSGLNKDVDTSQTFNTQCGRRKLFEKARHELLHQRHETPIVRASSKWTIGYASRMTPGYAHATWDAMVEAIAKLKQFLPLKQISFAMTGGTPKSDEKRTGG
jgi:hypothetical protein